MECIKCKTKVENRGSFRCSKCGILNTCCARCGIYLGRASRKNADYVLNGDKTYLICLDDKCKKEGDIPLWV